MYINKIAESVLGFGFQEEQSGVAIFFLSTTFPLWVPGMYSIILALFYDDNDGDALLHLVTFISTKINYCEAITQGPFHIFYYLNFFTEEFFPPSR